MTINYRLGALGFLATPELKDAAPGTANATKGTNGNWWVRLANAVGQ